METWSLIVVFLISSTASSETVSCPSPKQPLHGRLVQKAYNGVLNIYQSTIRYDCDLGYRMVGPQFRKCQADRTWSGNDTKCEEILCDKPSSPENGKVYFTDESVQFGSQIEYICEDHHIMEPITSQFAICTEHGHWSSPKPRCIKTCKVPALSDGSVRISERCNIANIENGHFRNSGIVIVAGEKIQSGSNIRLICSDGYELYNESNSMYLESEHTDIKCYRGSFTAEIPTCTPKRCSITKIVNGHFRHMGIVIVAGEKIQSGSNIRVTCLDGYELYNEPNSMYLESEHTDINCYRGSFTAEIPSCKPKRCSIRQIENGHFRQMGIVIVAGEKIQSGSNILLVCADGYELYNERTQRYLNLESTVINCYQASFTAAIPSCKPRRCLIDPQVNLEYFIKGKRVLDRYIHNGTQIQSRCPDLMELVRFSEYLDLEEASVKCNMGTLDPGSLGCKDKRCNIVNIENGHFRNSGIVIVAGEKIQSGSNIRLICSDGYELYNESNSMYLESEHTDIKCYRGSFTAEIPTCTPRRCLIEPPVSLEYFIEGKKVLDRNIDNGTLMQARCPDRMELVLSSVYLDIEETSVQCTLGTLEPRTLHCKYKRCKLDSSRSLIPEVNYVEHGNNLTVRCLDKMETHNETSVFCSKGIWTPELPRCIKKVCDEPAFQYTIIKNGTLVNEGRIFSHGMKLNASCDSSSKLYADNSYRGYSTSSVTECNDGEWEPKFSCKNIGRCIIPNDPGMQVTHIQNGAVVADRRLEEGDKIVVSCKLGYEIDASSGSENGYEYDYSDADSTGYPVEVPEARPISDGTFTCSETGKWEPEIRFTCKHITCHSLDDYGFENGRIIYSSQDIYNVGTVASFTCNPGYTRAGPAERTCQEDGTWSGTCVTCQSKTRNSLTMCPAPCVPDWAIKTGSQTYNLGSRVELKCLPTKMQYSGDSSNIRHCVNDSISASWNGTLINCKGLRDVSLRMIADGVADVWANLSTALGIQSNQVIVAADEPSRKALHILQYWRDIVMRDKPKSLIPDLIIVMETLQKRAVAVALRSLNGLEDIRCKHPSLNGTVKPDQSDYLFGQSVRVSSCDDGYMLANQSYLVCSEKGTWLGNSTCRHAICSPECGINGKCVRDNECRCLQGFSGKTCDEKVETEDTCSLQSVPGTLYSYNITRDNVIPGPVSSGRRIKVTCKEGYIPVSQRSDVSMCINGVWEPDISRCEKKVSCGAPNILNVIVDPSKETYAVNENVSLTGCLKGLDLVGVRSLLCLKDGSWHGNAQCTSYCHNGRIQWNATSYKRVSKSLQISYRRFKVENQCFEFCAKESRCKAVYIYKHINREFYNCMSLLENTRVMPDAFIKEGLPTENVYDRHCDDACLVPKDLKEFLFYPVDSPYTFKKVQDGTVMSIKCHNRGLRAVPDLVTCMGGQWSHPAEKIACIR